MVLNDSHISTSLTRFDLERISLIVDVRDGRYGTFANVQYTAQQYLALDLSDMTTAATCELGIMGPVVVQASLRGGDSEAQILSTAAMQ